MSNDTPPLLTKQDFIDAINAAGSSHGAGIGLAKGQKPIGMQHIQPSAYHDARDVYRRPGQDISQFGTPLRADPYQPGDEWKPGSGGQDRMRAIQQSLVIAGLLSPQDVRPIWDSKAADAYKVVLAYANIHGMQALDALNVFVNSPKPNVAGQRAPTALTNPADSQDAIAGQAASMIGGGLPTSEASDFSTYQQVQDQAAIDRGNKADAAGQSSFVGAPNTGADARQYLLAHNQQDIVNYDMALRTLQFSQALKEL